MQTSTSFLVLLSLLQLPQVATAALASLGPSAASSCTEKVSLSLSLVGETRGLCYSKGFLYRGGRCSEYTELSCQDLDSSLSSSASSSSNKESYVVVSHPEDPSLVYYEGYLNPGDYFYVRDGLDLPDTHNVTVYEDERMSRMVQTMRVYSPCQDHHVDLESLPTSTVQLVFTAVEPSIPYQVMLMKNNGIIRQQEEDNDTASVWTVESLQTVQPKREDVYLQDGARHHFGGRKNQIFQMELKASEMPIEVVAQVVSPTGERCVLEATLEEEAAADTESEQ